MEIFLYKVNRMLTQNTVKLTEVSFSSLFPHFWNKSISINEIKTFSSYINKIPFENVIAWSSIDFPNLMSKTLNENPWERLEILNKLFDPISLTINLMSKYLTFQRVYDTKIVSNFLETLKSFNVENIRLFDPLNDLNFLGETINLCIKKDMNVEGTILINPINPDFVLPKKVLELYKKSETTSVILFEPTGTLRYQLIRRVLDQLKNELNLSFKLSFSGRKDELTYIIGNFLKSELNIIGIDVTSLLNYPDPCPPNLITILSLFHDLDIKTNIDLNKVLRLQNDLCLMDIKDNDCNKLGIMTNTDLIKKKIPIFAYQKLVNILKENNKKNLVDKTLIEFSKVQKDLAYPPCIPPFTDFLLSQAIFNCVDGKKKYSTIVPEIHNFLSGYNGKTSNNISKKLKELNREGFIPSTIDFDQYKNLEIYENWKLDKRERLAYEIATKEAEIYFMRKFSKIPDEIDLNNRKTLASLVISIIKNKDPVQPLIIKENTKTSNINQKTWSLVGRLDQMGTKF